MRNIRRLTSHVDTWICNESTNSLYVQINASFQNIFYFISISLWYHDVCSVDISFGIYFISPKLLPISKSVINFQMIYRHGIENLQNEITFRIISSNDTHILSIWMDVFVCIGMTTCVHRALNISAWMH